jgi:hypothetical protein
MVQLWALAPFLEGLAGHEYDALRDLATFFASLQRSEQAQLLMTGDLTSSGSTSQFAAGDNYLRQVLLPPQGQYVGLGVPDWRDRGIQSRGAVDPSGEPSLHPDRQRCRGLPRDPRQAAGARRVQKPALAA